MTYAVKALENLFTWCGHERYLMIWKLINHKIIHEGNKCGNVL